MFAPVGRMTSLSILLALAGSSIFEVQQADVGGAYLDGKFMEGIYMELPKGIKPQGTNNALRLRKSQYGLRQSGRTLWIELREGLATTGFRKLESDWGLYYRPSSIATKPMLVLAYANDIVLAASTHGTSVRFTADSRNDGR